MSETTTPLAVPTVHLNGTSRRELLEQICTALTALQEAEAAVRRASPHGRDYYPQGEDAIGEALRQHTDRLLRLHAIYVELETIGERICFGGTKAA